MAHWTWNRFYLSLLMVHYLFAKSNSDLIDEKINVDEFASKKKLNVRKISPVQQPAMIRPEQDPGMVRPPIIIDDPRPPIKNLDLRICCNVLASQCNSTTPYRTIDGTCNNLQNPCWGAAGIAYRRLLHSQYENGLNTPRGSGRNPPLPRSRDVSVAMTATIVPPNPDGISLMVMQWGQFLDHDMVLTPNDAGKGSVYFSGFGTSCCDDFKTRLSGNPSCSPVDVTKDSFYKQFNVTCLPFIRSTASPCENEVTGPIRRRRDPKLAPEAEQNMELMDPAVPIEQLPPRPIDYDYDNGNNFVERQQLNDVTAYIDGSQVYGSTEGEKAGLRVPNSYRLQSGPGNEGNTCNFEARKTAYAPVCPLNFLPVRNNFKTGKEEFFAGDERVEEQPGLTSLHTCFVRIHNEISDKIATNNPKYSFDDIFEKTRQIIGAMMQQITYNEFLPTVLGDAIMTSNKLKLQPNNSADPYFYNYDPAIDASAQNELAAAAFRFGHSLIKDEYTLPNNVKVKLSESFNNHLRTTISGTFPSHFLRGIILDSSEEMDHILGDAVRNKLLATFPFQFGSDLYAFNIERGREHGLAAYKDYFNSCGGVANSFDDLYKVMPKNVVDVLKKIYGGRLDDVDLYPASIAENNLPGSLLGPTFACILAKHFSGLKFGDRFWFENPKVFTTAQLKSIRKTTLSALLCRCTDAVELQEFVMLPVNASNPLQKCSSLTEKGLFKDISLW